MITTTATPESFVTKLEESEVKFIYAATTKNPTTSESNQEQQQQRRDSACYVDGENEEEEIGIEVEQQHSAQEDQSISNANDNDNDGFRTPTAQDRKIPAVKQCPPAPRKRRPITRSRRSSIKAPADVGRSLKFYISDDMVKSILSSSFGSDLHQKIKKARKDDHGVE